MEERSEPPPPRIKIRIESLSDLVFGLALSIGSIILVGKAPQSGEDLAVNVLLFGFGFVIVVMAWLGYSRTMAVLPVEVPFALLTNLVLLFLVALEPYLLYVLFSAQTNGMADATSIGYALDVGAMFLMQAALAYLVVRQEKVGSHEKPLHPVILERFKRVAKVNLGVGVIFALSALPFFWVETPLGYLRFVPWYFTFPILAIGFSRRRSASKQTSTSSSV